MSEGLTIVVAMDRARGIGRQNELPWRLPDDLGHFKQVTMGHTVLMGRRTYESIGRPLPGRRNIVLTRSESFEPDGCEICHDFAEVAALQIPGQIFVIGGAAVYAAALPLSSVMWVTHVDAELMDLDVFFPAFDLREWRETQRTSHPVDERHAYAFDIVRYERLMPGI